MFALNKIKSNSFVLDESRSNQHCHYDGVGMWGVVATGDTVWKPFIAVWAINFLISLLDAALPLLVWWGSIHSNYIQPTVGWAILIVEKSNFMFLVFPGVQPFLLWFSAPNILIDTSQFSTSLSVSADLNSKVSPEKLWVKFSSRAREGPFWWEISW